MIKTILAVALMAIINTNNINKEGMYAKIKTNKGDIMLELEFEKTPLTLSLIHI